MLKQSANQKELFEADEFSVDWGAHQIWRIERIMNIQAKRLGVDITQIRLGFEAKRKIELMNSAGERLRYRPSGIIERLDMPRSVLNCITLSVAWIDPWDYVHQDDVPFIHLRVQALDEMSFARRQRQIRLAQQKMRAPQQPE
jgi:hypothetical protein